MRSNMVAQKRPAESNGTLAMDPGHMNIDLTYTFAYFCEEEGSEGMVTERKRKKTKIIPGTQPKARAGWPKRLRLVQATP